MTLTDVRRVFAAMGPAGPPAPEWIRPAVEGGRPAAVLVPLFEEDGDTRVVLTRRSSNLRSHTGEVAFPGGRLEPSEAPLAGALREASEEVGLDPAVCDVLGELTPLSTMSSSAAITPVVAALPGRPHLRPNPHEVERIFDVALSELVGEGVFREERWPWPDGDRPVYFFELEGDTVWGATARILHQLLDVVTGRVPFGHHQAT
ncbi:MAG TPA: CoA pyrophosphatase [Acidimicrobiales bacterium]|nr:CoA pyrophosphatase [Acidimicrobiales bacterium]